MDTSKQKEIIYIPEAEVSRITGIALQTLRNKRFHKKGIPYYKIGKSVRYRITDVYDYMESRRIDLGGTDNGQR